MFAACPFSRHVEAIKGGRVVLCMYTDKKIEQLGKLGEEVFELDRQESKNGYFVILASQFAPLFEPWGFN